MKLKKILSEMNIPNIVYHGTENKFTTFNDNEPIFFVNSKEVARTYGINIIKAKLSMNNPIELDFNGRSTITFMGKNYIPSKLAKYIKSISDDLKQYGRLDDDFMEELEYEWGFSDKYGDLDGIIMYNLHDAGTGIFNDAGTQTNYVVFDKSQIKIIK